MTNSGLLSTNPSAVIPIKFMLGKTLMTPTQYMINYPPRLQKVPSKNNDEDRLLVASDGVLTVANAPLMGVPQAAPNGAGADQARHLWVIRPDIVPVPAILERSVVMPSLKSGVVKHANLTGAAPASCGGEFWADPADPSLLYVNGASGRYGPDTPQALEDAVAVFKTMGFAVRSFGWDTEQNLPARFYRAQ